MGFSRKERGEGGVAGLTHRYHVNKTLFEQAVVSGQAGHLVVLMKHLCHGSIIVKQAITTP
jgi:hypothetical protein